MVRSLASATVAEDADRHLHAGGPRHYAAYLEDTDGYEAELVAGLTSRVRVRGRSRDDLPIRIACSPAGRIQSASCSDQRANARLGTISRAVTLCPGAAVTAVNAASVRGGSAASLPGG